MADKREREVDPAEEEEEEEEWIGPMPTEAAKPKKRKGKHSSSWKFICVGINSI